MRYLLAPMLLLVGLQIHAIAADPVVPVAAHVIDRPKFVRMS
jgi:hypothetical protein